MGVTFEQIKKANECIETLNLRGKDYAQVHQRIKAFRMVHPNGRIITEIEKLEDGMCVMRATICGEDGQLLATGTAYEKENSSNVNKTSFIENCETSAVGRALGMCGFGIDAALCSAEEQINADIQQDILKAEDVSKQKINEVKVKALLERCGNDNVSILALCELYKVKAPEDLTERQYANIHEHWDKIKAK